MADKNNLHLSSIQQLIQDAWKLFKRTWFVYLKLVGLSCSYLFLVFLVGILIAFPLTFIAFGSHLHNVSHFTPFTIIMLVLFAVWLVLFLLSFIVITIIAPIISILIFQEKETTSIFNLIKQSKQFFWPYFLTFLLSGLAVIGGIMFFIIPGLLIAYLFTFVIFEVVIEGESGQSALKRSCYMIKTHFWSILGRLIILELGIAVIMSIVHSITANISLGLVQFLFAIFISFYVRAYVYLLYKEVRARTTFPQHISLRWVWILSSIGWAFTIFIAIMLALNASHLLEMIQSQSHQIHRIRTSNTA